jgi:phage terminase small subunit
MKINRIQPDETNIVEGVPKKPRKKTGRKPGGVNGAKQKRSKNRRYFKVKPFVEQYLVDHNAVKAWQRAFGPGEYSADAHNAQQALARPDVQQMIHERQQEILEKSRVNVTQEQVIQELMAIAFSNIKDIIKWEPNGGITYKGSDALTRQQAGAISEINQTIRPDGGGSLKFKFYNKMDALVMIGKYLGLFFDDDNSKKKDPVEEAKKIKNALMEMDDKMQTKEQAIKAIGKKPL